jgi:hypothetical protein
VKHFNLLWRDHSDGFTPMEFHHCWDSHMNTLTLISDTKQNIFSDFIPVEWESHMRNRKYKRNEDNRWKGDDNL